MENGTMTSQQMLMMEGDKAFYGPLFALIIFIVFVALIVLLVRWFHKNRSGSDVLKDATLPMLKDLLAKGEINAEEFKHHKNRLKLQKQP